MSTVQSLEVRLGDLRVGYLTHYPDEKTVFVVSDDFLDLGSSRPILTLSMARPGDEAQTRTLLRDERHKSASIKAPPFFSNLLPEGGLRSRIARRLKVHEDREFLLLAALGYDLPGAVVLVPADTPDHLRLKRGLPLSSAAEELAELKFSLGGMQMKFSMLRQGKRYTLNTGGSLGNYIVKPPSGDFEALPQVEAATMETARAVGIDVPEVALLSPQQIDGLPDMSGYRQGEPFYAIWRFDRPEGGRRHVEDFAQVFNLRPTQKYGRVNYDMIALTLLRYAGGLPDLKEMTRRLVLNVLLGNGDAHIKNWSLLYDDPKRPRLAPAYDLVSTVAYTTHDTSIALNMAGVKRFDMIGLDTFAALFTRIGLHDQVCEDLLDEVRSTARRVLDAWQAHFAAAGVPVHLTRKVEAHVLASKLHQA
ncbi:type II toxin-antitoxin system HipA family toxin [Verminephrobacter aporrectodeae subsp. tuberculatae]|uniref:type II toxin-antitoxin system HipA family toxin n=1 Tax=Verminephrobacter aporrectodeae TaxID=1110389 RepID=UPI0022444A63|nr:HipA domain-containing protein [Verminephrobacter aporrectodeae]MCW8207582.1 type II toxin-antitoxin system HipA family toxin [Verminephrobacter aporrectodeae subsp. tuberculatae]